MAKATKQHITTHEKPAAPPPPVGRHHSEYPEEIFGTLHEGFVLELQPIDALCFWHREGHKVVGQFDASVTDEKLVRYSTILFDLLQIILSAPARTAGDVARKLGAVALELALEPARSIEEVLDADDIVRLFAELNGATTFAPTKRVGALHRGRKLTRAGLLHRYHAFLAQELQTVSWNLYGDRDYASHYVPYDAAVDARCGGKDRDPFFDESRLTTRARAVLGKLKIDTVNADRLMA